MRYIVILIITLSACSHSNQKQEETKITFNHSYELDGKDTFNRIDAKGRQGLWIVYDRNHFVNSNYTKSSSGSSASENKISMTTFLILEKGMYKDNAKQGTWLFYNTDGSLKDSLYYREGVPVKQ